LGGGAPEENKLEGEGLTPGLKKPLENMDLQSRFFGPTSRVLEIRDE